MNIQQRAATFDAVLHSVWVTFLSIALALIVAAGASGATGNVGAFLAFLKTQWFTVILIQVIAPAIRGALAAKGTN